MLALLVFMVLISYNGLASLSTDHSCLTWTIKGFNLELICRASNISYPLYFRDTDGEVVGRCTTIEQDCISFHKYGIIKINLKTSEVILTIQEIEQKYVNGKWTCENGENKFQTEVSTSKGIASATDIFIRGEVLKSSNKVKITCYSCRQPYRNNIEFLVDGESIDSISFNRETDRCINGIGVSHPDIFTCDPSGASFVHIFELHNTSRGIHFSCDMRFVDPALLSRFTKKATIYFDGKQFYDNGSISETIKHANPPFIEENQRDVNNMSITTTSTSTAHDMGSNENSGDRTYLWILVIVVMAIILPGILIPFCYCVYRKHKKRKKKKHRKEALHLLSANKTIKIQQRDKKFDSIKDDCMNVTIDVTKVELAVVDKNCAPCEKREAIISKATVWCFDCVAAFCYTCIIYHSSMTFDDAHCVVDIRELPNNYDIPFLCGAHCQSKLEYLCVLHNVICCKKCAVENHGCCDSVSPLYMILHRFQISNMGADCQERISAVLKTLQNLIQNYNCNITSVENDKKHIQLQIHNVYEETISDINSSPEIENAIENHKTRLNLDLKNRTKKIISNIEGKIFELEIVLKTTKEHDYLLKFTSKNGSEKHSFLVMKYLESRLGDSERQLEKHVEDRICVHLRYEEDGNDLHKAVGRVETIYITPESIELRHKILRESQIPVTAPISKNLEVLKWFNIYEIPDMLISGITITASGLIILCDRGKPRIIVMSETGDKQTPLNLEFQPWEIAAIPFMEIIAIICTKYDYILFIDAFKRSFIRKISIEGSAKCCIACTNSYIFLGGVNKIDVLRHKGTTAQYFKTVKMNFLVKSLSCCESNEIIYFSSNESDKLLRVDMNGTTLVPLETKNLEIQTNLKCIRVDGKNNIYFLDSTKHDVHKLSKGGEYLGIVELGIKTENTKAITFNNDYTKLYLLHKDMGRPCISVFSQIH